MAENRQLINGGQASPDNIFYWSHKNTTVASDSVAQFYRITNGGSIEQISRLPIRGLIKFSCAYKLLEYDCSAELQILLTYDTGKVEQKLIYLTAQQLNDWAYFSIDINIPDDAYLSSMLTRVSYTGDSFLAINNLSAITHYSNLSGSVNLNEFVEKSILYGLDIDKPVLGKQEEVTRYDRRR